MIFQLFVDIQNLRTGSIKTGQQLAADNQNINFAVNEFSFERVFVIIGIAVLLHHLVPERNNEVIRAFVNFFRSFAQIRRGNDNSRCQIAKLFKTLLITNRIFFEIAGKHCLETSVFITFKEMLIDIQRNALNTRIGRRKPLHCAPFVTQICLLRICQTLRDLLKPKVNIFFVNMLVNKSSFVNQRNNRIIFYAVFNGIFVNQLAETLHRVLFVLHKRSSGEANITGVGEYGTHLRRKRAIVGTMAFINEYKNIS